MTPGIVRWETKLVKRVRVRLNTVSTAEEMGLVVAGRGVVAGMWMPRAWIWDAWRKARVPADPNCIVDAGIRVDDTNTSVVEKKEQEGAAT